MKGKDMLSGLKDKAPATVDSSMKPMGGSVNSEVTRSETAPPQPTIGPRCA